MKAKIAAALSVVGVLGAGSAAALVNTQILDNGPTESGASKAVLPPAPTVELTVPALAAPEVETVVVDMSALEDRSTTTIASTTTLAPEPASTGFLTSFNVGDAGVVTVDVIEGQLVLVAAEPAAGWTVTKAEDDSNDDTDEHENTVEVEFVSSSVRVEFDAQFIDGQIVPHVESKAIGGAVSAAPAAPAPAAASSSAVGSSGSDDAFESEHDDEYEHESEHESEHDDEYEDERDDD